MNVDDVDDRLAALARDDAPEWKGLKLPARIRLAKACQHLRKTGELNRSDIIRIGEVSRPQAALDLREIRRRAPWAIQYDFIAKCYRLRGKA